ncbi:MAG TPA: acyltransferase family protein [Bacteroidales bacterium]|jgi:peptidoglycan/LPS O-acetylase OafA/YrhL|nr:acyltransferase family protein [Bacteroidales bacterium]
MAERRYDLDWLRVMLMLLVFIFHCSRFFGGGPWLLKNAEESIVALVYVSLIDMWVMPCFFLLSGIGSWYALAHFTNGQYIQERIKRILIPLYTAGFFILLPTQFYFEIYSNAGFTGTFWESIPLYLAREGHFHLGSPSGVLMLAFITHLWFLGYLFLISLMALPLMRYLRSEHGLRFTDKLAGWCSRPGAIFIFIIPVLVIRIGLRSFFLGQFTWADFLEYMAYFIIGYLFMADSRFIQSAKKNGWLGLILGLACWGCQGIFVLGFGYHYPDGEPFSWMYVLFEAMMSISRWSWIIFVLSLGAKYLNFNHRSLTYSNEAVLPFYLLHQPIILGVGWFVIQLHIGMGLKFLIITLISFVLIMAVYDLFVRRFNVVRFFFGMRPIKKSSA